MRGGRRPSLCTPPGEETEVEVEEEDALAPTLEEEDEKGEESNVEILKVNSSHRLHQGAAELKKKTKQKNKKKNNIYKK